MAEPPTTAAKLTAEFIGTFLLVFTVGCNVLGQTAVFAAVSIASVLMVMIYSFGAISGGNFNPAVSVMLGLVQTMGAKKQDKTPAGMGWTDVGMYCGTQIAAGIVAGFSYFALFGKVFNLGPAKGFNWAAAGACEFLYTFMLTFVVFNAAVSKYRAVQGNQYYGLAIGFVVIAGAYGAGAISGGCFNPAVAIGIDVSSAHLGIGYCLMYTVCELLGAAAAAALSMVVRPLDFSEEDEPEKYDPPVSAKLVSEFIGTFILVLTVGLNVLGKSPAGAFSIAASLMCMIYALGDVSGANFNPAVTLAIYISKLSDMTPATVGMYMGAQIAGGVVAAFTYAAIYSGQTFPLGPGGGYGWIAVAFAEIMFTLVLCLVVLTVAVADPSFGTHNGTMFGLAIGSCVTVGGFAIGSISGGSLNPAVSCGIAAAQILNGGFFYKALIYSVFEFIGAAAAAGIVMQTHKKETVEDKAV